MSVRGAAAIGAGLAPARPARPIRPGERIHVLGAAGAGASAAALHAAWAGASVDGCDPGGRGPYTAALDAAGIALAPGHDAAHVRGAARLAVTKALTAVDPDHPELAAARKAGIPLEPWQQLVADAAAGRTLVAVAGTHGKSTTAGWLVHALAHAGLDPAAFVGALLPADLAAQPVAATARPGRGPFVVEADEYAGNFDPYLPAVAVVTSAEWDHPDVFADRAAVVDAFEGWLRRGAADGAPASLVLNVGDPGVAELARRLADWPVPLTVVRLASAEGAGERAPRGAEGDPPGDADLAARHATAGGPARVLAGQVTALAPGGTELVLRGDALGAAGSGGLVLRLATAGLHNAANALGAAGAALACGVPAAALAGALGAWTGVGRRLERKGEAGGVVVYDDYGHHPTAIRATLAAVRQREPGRRTWAVYEPLTFHRTAALLDAFAEVLAEADAVAVADIWAGRDPDTTVASAEGLAAAVAARRPGIPCAAPGSIEATAAWLAGEVRAGDAVLVMGGGRSYRIAELLLDHLARR